MGTLVSDLRGNAFSFSPLSIMFTVCLSYMRFIILRYDPSMSALGKSSFYDKWVLNFVKNFLWIYWDDYIVFIFQFVNMVYHIDWFIYIEKSLHLYDKAHLIMMCDPFCVFLDFARAFLRIFSSMFISDIDLQFSFFLCLFFFSFFFWNVCLLLVSGWWWSHRMSWGVFLPLQFSWRVWAM